MNFKVKISSILLVAMIFVSCSKSYLDKTPYTAGVLSTAIKTEADLATADNGAYATMRSYYLFGASIPIKGDLMADNTFVASANSGRYIGQNNFSLINTDAYAANFWSLGYQAIKYANTVIHNTLGLTTVNANQYLGEAYAIRALMYFELVQNFAHAYTLAPNDPGIPLVPDDLSYDPSITSYQPARNTVTQVYTQIISDLEKAYGLMTVYRGTAYFSKYAARAIEARVYQNKGDWANALTTALDVINNSGWVLLAPSAYVNPAGSFGTTLTSGSFAGQEASTANTYSPGGYWANPVPQTSTSKNETLFESASDLSSNNGFEQIGSLYLKLGGGYGDICATDDLYNLYSATDVRKGLIPRAPAGYRAGQAGNINLCYKYPNAFAATDRDDVKVIRLSDVILIAAEAYYNAGDIVNANKYLNMVAKQRDPAFAGYADAGAQVLEDILIERRKELAFEGLRLWDLVRLNRSWTKYRNQNPLTTLAASASNTQVIYPIPLGELNANPNMVQNPGY